MSLNAKNAPGGGAKIEPMDQGTYPARVVQIVSLGLQKQRPFQGQDKPPAREIAVTYEFVDEFLKDEDGNDQTDKPRWLTERFPFYNLEADKAKSTKRYLALDPTQEHEGDWSKLVFTPCMVTVVHNPNKKTGGVFENIADVAPMRAKDQDKCPPLVDEDKAVVFDLDEPDMDVFNTLAPWVQKIIKENLEFEGSALQKALKAAGESADAPPKQENNEPDVEEKQDEENPY